MEDGKLEANRYHITWVGSYTERVLKGINEVNPDKITFLIESKSTEWIYFQKESLEVIQNYLGDRFKDKNRMDIVEFPFQDSEDGVLKLLFYRLYGIISEIKNKNEKSSITIDVTATPKTVTFLITFLKMTLSDNNTRIRIMYTSKGIDSIPSYYAPSNSKFCTEPDMTLCEYRRLEKEDKGGDIAYLEVPIINFSLFNINENRTPFLLALFRKIPNNEVPLKSKHNITIYEEMMKSDKEIIDKYIDLEKIKKRGQDYEIQLRKSTKTKISLGLKEFHNWGIIDLDKDGNRLYVKKSWAGELISKVIEDLYNTVKHHL